MTISLLGESAIYTQESTDWWYEDPSVLEYELDPQVLSDIETIFYEHEMQEWKNKKFTDMILYDGPTYFYTFRFDNREYISFSSQIFEEQYEECLTEISDVVHQYISQGVILPGLSMKEKTEEELQEKNHPDDGSVELEVYSYQQNKLYVRVSNGTDENVSLNVVIQVIRNSDGMVLHEHDVEYVDEIDAHSSEDEIIQLNQRLEEGTYTVRIDEYEEEFEIKMQ